jgi:hypothetical protein
MIYRETGDTPPPPPPPPITSSTKPLPAVGDTVWQRFEDGNWYKGIVRASGDAKGTTEVPVEFENGFTYSLSKSRWHVEYPGDKI